MQPPETEGDYWRSGFQMARVSLTDLLLPDGAFLADHFRDHEVTEADAQAVEAMAEGNVPISQIREGLFSVDAGWQG